MGGGLQVDPAVCRALAAQAGVQHRPAPDVAYAPGVDAMGRPVAPADLAPYPTAPATPPVVVELKVPQSGIGRVPDGRVPGRAGVVPDVSAGFLTLAPDGTVLLNGQPVEQYGQGDPRSGWVEQLCRAQGL